MSFVSKLKSMFGIGKAAPKARHKKVCVPGNTVKTTGGRRLVPKKFGKETYYIALTDVSPKPKCKTKKESK